MKRKSNLKFSVITVTYNCRDTLERAMSSVLEQKYEGIEYIVIDGASSDGTLDIIDKYTDKLAYFISEPDDGIYDAMNKGVQHATGDVICFLNSDDYYLESNALSKVATAFEESAADIVAARADFGYGLSANVTESLLSKLKFQMIFIHQALFVKKHLFDKIGEFDSSLKYAADYKWMLQVYNDGYKIYGLDDVVVFYSRDGRSSGIECIDEMKQIAVLNSELHCDIFKSDIDIEYRRILDDWHFERVLFYSALEKRLKIYRQLFGGKEKIVLWGAGYWGGLILNSIRQCGFDIVKVIDKAGNKDNFYGIPVEDNYAYLMDAIVVITTDRYEEEIAIKLNEQGLIEKVDFLRFSYVKKIMIGYDI